MLAGGQQQQQQRRIINMTSSLTNLIPKTLLQYCLSEQSFSLRFQPLQEIQDPYVRIYELSLDSASGQRVAVRNYTAVQEQQMRDVVENMESFRKLGDVEGMCRLIAFTRSQTNGIISAAFEYSDFSMEEIAQGQQLRHSRQELYIALLKEMTAIIDSARATGIIIEEIVPSCILLQQKEGIRMKILYDEREKRYEKIQQGIKVMASPEKIQAAIREGRDYQSENCEEAVFELGLFLLDFMYEMESRSIPQEEAVFSKDVPLQRHNLSHKSYLTFLGRNQVELNRPLIKQKIQFLSAISSPCITCLIDLAQNMMANLPQRISIDQLPDKVQILEVLIKQNTWEERKAPDSFTFITPNKQQLKEERGEKKEQYLRLQTNQLKNVTVSLTTAATQPTSTTDYLPKFHEQPDIVLPREKLLSQARSNAFLLPKFQQFINKLQYRNTLAKKEYFDSSVYYGQLNANGKRNGMGIYLYNNGDIYFGGWKDNTLVDGNYLFRNGESFEGVVKGGKQGHGRYCYSNGNVYEGEWRDDVKNGMGKMKYPNGDIYEGMWSKGKKNGKGKYFYSNGSLYQGQFADGKKNGFGVITFPNGTKVEAHWNQTHIEGPGKVFYSNGNFFQGNYHLSEKEGKGYYKWQDTQYQGEFKKDLMEGQACIRFSEREYYKGGIRNGKRDGEGYYLYSNGDEFKGSWRNDEKMIGHYKFHQGGSFQGKFKGNQMSYGKMVYENDEKYQGEFLRGQRHGNGIYHSAKGEVLFQGRWQHDQFIAHY